MSKQSYFAILILVLAGILAGACTPAPETEAPAPTEAGAPAPATEAPAPATEELGELVPPIMSLYPNQPQWIEFWRAQVPNFEELGLELELEACEFSVCIEKMILEHDYGNLASIDFVGREERIDPHFFLFEMLHSDRAVLGGNNMAWYSNPEYDALVDQQASELDQSRRQELVWEIQEMIARDRPSYVLVFPDIIQPYNSDKWAGVVPRLGSGIARTNSIWTYIGIEPLTDQTELRVGWLEEPPTLNPLAERGDVEHIAMLRFIYDTFVKLSPDLGVTPWAAESWNWVDDTTLDIVLRERMEFHDGEPVTVEDVKFTFDYVKEWDFPVWQQVTRQIENVEILDDRTVRFTLPAPFPAFLENILTYAIILPQHIWENVPEGVGVDVPDNWEPEEMGIGSGPFKYGFWNRGQEVFLEANPDHWAAPNIDGVHFISVPSLEGLLGQMETQELDIVDFVISPTNAEQLESLGYVQTVGTPNHGFYVTAPDVTTAPFNDVAFRRAVDQILDRQLMLNDVFGGAGSVAIGDSPITPLNEFWHNPNLENLEFNIADARQALADAGYGWDEEGRLHYPPE